MAKRRKSSAAEEPAPMETDAAQPSTSGQPNYTVSIAVPGSIAEAAGTAERAAAISGQIARAAAVFGVHEIIVYDDSSSHDTSAHGSKGTGTISAGAALLARALQYLETPPYLRSSLPGLAWVKKNPQLHAALESEPPLSVPHHAAQEWREYREGAVLRSEPGASFVDVGLDRNAFVDVQLPIGARVTVHLGESASSRFVPEFSETMLVAEVVPPSTPRDKLGWHTGFTVRLARSLSYVWKDSPYKGGYDFSVGTAVEGVERGMAELVLPQFKHALVVFGGTQGLEEIVEGDDSLVQAGKQAADCFNMYLNTCPGQSASSIRTEDSVFISLAMLNPALQKFGK